MGFQNTVYIELGSGVPGEMFNDSPWIVESYTINSALASYNVIGATACTVTSEGFCQAGSGGTYGFAGILVDPKDIALFGAGGIPLAPTLVVPNFSIVECATAGKFFVTLPGAANIGDYVIYDNTTGALSTISPTTPLPVGKSFANAVVDFYQVGGAGLAVINMSQTFIIPQPA